MNEQSYNNLVELLKLFKDRPYHLAKYLIEKDAFTEVFIKKLEKARIKNRDIIFTDITKMEEYYSSLIDKIESNDIVSINNKLDQLLMDEKYEEAILIRDYMIKNNIPRIK